MTKTVISILIFLANILIPIWVLSLFPTPCGYGLCLLIYYPIIFTTGGLSAFLYYKFSNRLKINKTILISILLVVDASILAVAYPKGEYHPINQWKSAQVAYERYDELLPEDLFESIESRNFLLTAAIDHKFTIPDHVFELHCCTVDSTGSCDLTVSRLQFYVLNDSMITSKPDTVLQLSNGIVSVHGTFDSTSLNLRFSTDNFGTFKKEYDNFSSNLGERGTGITGLSKDTANIRLMIWKQPAKFEYKFTKKFQKWLTD
ncbi:hypothetical protein [Marivirga sericea]|uniref:hypothetical protein n=1 Tax=Marivirga sericea TaxID=1028 RepID=UPI000A1CBF16|nr:hypothetical protein [Marivirga sericea]